MPDCAPAEKKITKDGLDVYWGEFLKSPVPLELSGNYCSHKCGYCFANLAQPGRTLDAKQVINAIRDAEKRKSYLAMLLRERRPICVSNHIDPFSASNVKQLIPIMQMMTDMGFPLAIQTKGGREKDVDEVLGFLPSSVWYLSIAFWDDDKRKIIEPGAPSIQSRIDLIRKLRANGHEVLVGINPFVPEWLPDPRLLIDAVAAAGAWGLVTEPLHLNKKQVANLSEKERAAIEADQVLAMAGKTKGVPHWHEWIRRILHMADDAGLHRITGGLHEPTRFFEPYERLYPGKCFANHQRHINWCHKNKDAIAGKQLGFDWYFDGIRDTLPGDPENDVLPIDSYLGMSRQLWSKKIPPRLTFKQVLRILWNEYELPSSLAKIKCFSITGREESDGTWTKLVDENGDLTLQFFPEGNEELWEPEPTPA